MKPRLKCEKCEHSTEDLTGQTFGRLTVVEHVCSSTQPARWKCLCQCGNLTVARADHLKRGATRSCGCLIGETLSKPRKHNKITLESDIAYIELPSGRKAIVDAEDVQQIEQLCWQDGWHHVGAHHNKTIIRLHHYILKIRCDKKHGLVVDHINSNPLDNRKVNLQICEQSSNNQKARRKVGKTGFIGVYQRGNCAPFLAITEYHGKRIYMNGFYTAEEAARAYDKKVLELHGPHARVNFPADES